MSVCVCVCLCVCVCVSVCLCECVCFCMDRSCVMKCNVHVVQIWGFLVLFVCGPLPTDVLCHRSIWPTVNLVQAWGFLVLPAQGVTCSPLTVFPSGLPAPGSADTVYIGPDAPVTSIRQGRVSVFPAYQPLCSSRFRPEGPGAPRPLSPRTGRGVRPPE